MHLVYPPKFCININFDFSRDDYNREEKYDGDITKVAKFLDHNNREFLQQQKSNRFRLAKEQLCTCVTRFFVHFLAVVA